MTPEEPEGKDRRTIVAEEEVVVVVVAVAVEEADFTLQQKQISLYRCMARTRYQEGIIRLKDKHEEA